MQNGYQFFISPHYYCPTDHGWQSERALEALMHTVVMFDRKGPLNCKTSEGLDRLTQTI